MGRITKHSESAIEPFVLDDGTGTAYVDPSNADVVLASDDEFEVEGGRQPPAFIEEFLEHETSVNPVGKHKRWYQEYRIELDGDVRVAGQADADAVPTVDDPVTTAVVAAGDAPKFLVTDDPDLGLGKRMLQEAFVYFLMSGVLFAFAYIMLFV